MTEVQLETTRVFGRLESSMTDLARFVQDHPYQVLYAILGLLVLWVFSEFRHLAEKRTLRQALWRPEVTPAAVPASPAPAPPKQRNGLGGLLLILIVIMGVFYLLPLVQGQRGQALAAPVTGAFTTGTYRGVGTGDLSSTNLTLTLQLVGSAKRVQLESALGTFDFEGQIMPESGGTYLSGTLMDRNGVKWGTLQAHVTPTQVSGTAGAGPIQWQLDLRR